MATLVELADVSKTYRSGELDVPVLRDVNLTIEAGSLTVIVGPSGSGKSTLLNLIGAIDRPTTGTVKFGDVEIGELSDKKRTQFRRESVGFVFQFYNLVPSLTALENVAVTAELRPGGLTSDEAIEQVGLTHRRDHFPAQLSGGEQQRVAIARAIVGQPQLLLCDEPTGALDLKTGQIVLELLSELSRQTGLTVLIITHNGPIATMADYLVRIGSGTITENTPNPHPTRARDITW